MSEWLSISELFDFDKGSLQSSKCIPGSYTFITAAEEWKTHDTFTHDCEALVFAMAASGSLGRTHYVSGKFVASDLCFILTPKKDKKLDLKFYYRIFNFLREDIVKKTATGTSKLAINQMNFGNYMLPYFDIWHQLLFSKKLDSISSVQNDLINSFNDQSDYLTQLRQVILQEAIEGKLTADWRKKNPVRKGEPDTDAVALLEKIKQEKQKLIVEGKIKKEKPLEPIKPAEVPFELPEGWVWCRLGEVSETLSTGPFGSMLHKSDYVKVGIPIVNPMNIIDMQIVPDERMLISEKTRERLQRYSLKQDDIVIARRGNLGKCAVVQKEQEGWLCGTGSFFLRLLEMNRSFFVLTYCSEKSQAYLLQDSIGQTMDNLNQKLLYKMLIPLPSLTEQQVIVERVNRLLAMVDDLEEQVKAQKGQAEELMQAVLREAFEG